MPISTGNVTTFVMIPITEAFDVCRLTSEPDAVRGGCVLVMKKGSKIRPADRIRWGGIAKERRMSKEKGARKELYLDPLCYTVLD